MGKFEKSLAEWLLNDAKEYLVSQEFSVDDATNNWLKRLVIICVNNVSTDEKFDIGNEFLVKFGEFFLKAFISLAMMYAKKDKKEGEQNKQLEIIHLEKAHRTLCPVWPCPPHKKA